MNFNVHNIQVFSQNDTIMMRYTLRLKYLCKTEQEIMHFILGVHAMSTSEVGYCTTPIISF